MNLIYKKKKIVINFYELEDKDLREFLEIHQHASFLVDAVFLYVHEYVPGNLSFNSTQELFQDFNQILNQTFEKLEKND